MLSFLYNEISVNERRAYTITGTIYNIAALGAIPIELVESVIQVPSYFTNEKKSMLYTLYIANAYYILGKYNKAL